MLESEQMFLFLFKSKYRRKYDLCFLIVCMLLIFSCVASGITNGTKCVDSSSCNNNGICKNDTCLCYDGWQGYHCEYCGGKVRLAAPYGSIHDGLGNYSIGVKCSWLIDAPNSTITLHLEEFATECGWDHLYIFDGDSVESPLLAVYSGLMYKHDYRIRRVPEVVAQSGAALIHFFSDDAYNMSGFNLTYRINGCPSIDSNSNCSGNGICIDGVCTCNAGWVGSACQLPICPNDCYSAERHGTCSLENHRCECNSPWTGADCGQEESKGSWITVQPQSFTPPGSASAGAVVWRDTLYIVAGQTYGTTDPSLIYTYDFNGNVWETQHLEGIVPVQRYGHSSVRYGDKIFMYGGVCGNRGVTKELWAFDVSAKVWENVTVRAEPCNATRSLCGPLKVAGHTATVVTGGNKKMDRMVVIFGHSPQFGYLNTVQEFYFGTREWRIVRTKGYPAKGGYGHSSTYDSFSQRIYVYGGVISESESAQALSAKLYSYDPHSRVWMMLADAPSARFLHTATFVNPGLMLVFGGNTHNDTSHSFGAKCYSSDLLIYDVLCDLWKHLETPRIIRSDLARFGHSAVTFEGSLFIYGGFDGQMLSDILKYTPGNCSIIRTRPECLTSWPGVKCVWERQASKCLSVSEARPSLLIKDGEDEYVQCPEGNRTSKAYSILLNGEKCTSVTDCQTCVQTSRGCKWCGSYCSMDGPCRNTTNGSVPVKDYSDCPSDPNPTCRALHTCAACVATPPCHWSYESHCSAPKNRTDLSESTTCTTACADLTSCLNCTQEECIWCQNEGRCVDKNAYTASFPYGQCREWTTAGARCRSGASGDKTPQCAFYTTCAQCRDDPACGWCDDGSGTGLGSCMAGGYQGPNLHDHSLPSSTCPPERWHFTTCPECQCNGHSTCDSSGRDCIQPCANDTVGRNCERCRDGFWGSPVNGGECRPCKCNGQATKCHHEIGKCYCTTKGLAGDFCEKCDATNHYTGDPLVIKGSCYYDLTIDYQFTFNLSKKEDRHYTQINFRNSPKKPDIDADFSITCSVIAKMNITVKTANGPEKPILSGHNCTTFRSRFNKADYNFGVEDNVTQTTFYVYVYDFQPPLWIQISFSQYPKLNLQQFFITFSSCFLALLLVAAVMWKIKQKYDMYRRRQRLFVEMEQMASRPFSQVLVEIERNSTESLPTNDVTTQTSRKKGKRDPPSPIALEPCAGNRAAVLSLFVRLPTGGEQYTPTGQSAGLAVASALVTLGNPRRSSIDQPKPTDQGKGKGSRKGQSQHPDGCI